MLVKITDSLARSYYADSGMEYDEDDLEVYSYGLQLFLSNVLEILFVVVLGLCIGRFFETVAFLGAFISLRYYAGGYHAKTYLRCFVGLLVVYGLHLVIISLTPAIMTYYLSLSILVTSTWLILKYAPIEDANKPIGPIQRKHLRNRSVLTLLLQTTIIIVISVCGIVLSYTGFNITGKIPHILLSFAIGQLTASGSLVAAIIGNRINMCQQ